MVNQPAPARNRVFYVQVMDKLYIGCISICVISIVCMTGLIFTGVVMRYFFALGARFAEPMSIFFTVQLTMYGAAACYRAHAHLRLEYFMKQLPMWLRSIPAWIVHLLMLAIAAFMIWYGLSLTRTTWIQAYPEFEYVKVGFVYSAIPCSGVVLLLFIIESTFWPHVMRDPDDEELERALEHTEQESRRLNAG